MQADLHLFRDCGHKPKVRAVYGDTIYCADCLQKARPGRPPAFCQKCGYRAGERPERVIGHRWLCQKCED